MQVSEAPLTPEAYTLANYASIYNGYGTYRSTMKRCYEMTAEGADIRETTYIYTYKTAGQIYELFANAESIEDWYILVDVLILYITRRDYSATMVLTKIFATIARHQRIASILKNTSTLEAIKDFCQYLYTRELLVPEIELYFMLIKKLTADLGHVVSVYDIIYPIKIDYQSMQEKQNMTCDWPSHGFIRHFLPEDDYTEIYSPRLKSISLCFFYDLEQRDYFYTMFRDTLKRTTGTKRAN